MKFQTIWHIGQSSVGGRTFQTSEIRACQKPPTYKGQIRLPVGGKNGPGFTILNKGNCFFQTKAKESGGWRSTPVLCCEQDDSAVSPSHQCHHLRGHSSPKMEQHVFSFKPMQLILLPGTTYTLSLSTP